MKEYLTKVRSLTKWVMGAIAVDGYRGALTSDNINNVLVEITKETDSKIKQLDQIKSNLEIREDRVSWLNTKFTAVHGRIEKMIQ